MQLSIFNRIKSFYTILIVFLISASRSLKKLGREKNVQEDELNEIDRLNCKKYY